MMFNALQSPDISDHQYKSAMAKAIKQGYVRGAQVILEGRKPKALNSHLKFAINKGHLDMVKLLVQHGAGKDDHYRDAFVFAG
ncbi:b07bb9f9-c170-4e9a-88a2-fb3ab7bda374-CDS [Sclerotinia trifoliorum]|uniref:B07bb9f9-c170-4e9a-88a2-fb3ab7bda374-CDS n=1 Tax=Sclerotinia trifoliorum TaxID=28548 RepID=A0A8H2W0R6_9HELO|nr:b07bb9f9-c170-4e9a-88a2-fb3ab7bda374-CDS [Sclerotinia trifoliorum]